MKRRRGYTIPSASVENGADLMHDLARNALFWPALSRVRHRAASGEMPDVNARDNEKRTSAFRPHTFGNTTPAALLANGRTANARTPRLDGANDRLRSGHIDSSRALRKKGRTSMSGKTNHGPEPGQKNTKYNDHRGAPKNALDATAKPKVLPGAHGLDQRKLPSPLPAQE